MPLLSLRFVILLVSMLAAPTTLTIVETGSIDGHVRDPQGKPIKSAMVDVVGTSLSTITNDSGYYVFPNVPVGAYTVRARLIGYSLSQAMTVRVTANATAVADLTLAPSAATLEAVVVSGYVPGRAANGVVRIRGATAAASRADALYVVDGVASAYDSTEAWRYPRQRGNREQYDEIVENQFIAVAADPLSTFSIDVDRASYSNMRRFIMQDGQLPPRDAIRIEELVNYFPYSYSEPQGDDPIAINAEVAPAPWKPQHQLVRIGLQARRIETDNLPASTCARRVEPRRH